MDLFFKIIVSEVAIIHAICGIFMPLFLIIIMTRFFGKNKSWFEGFSIFSFAIFAAFSFIIPYVLAGIFLAEFPSILGGLFGLALVTLAVKLNFLIPKDTWDFAPASQWPSFLVGRFKHKKLDNTNKKKISTPMAWSPYILLAIFLLIRTYEPLTNFLKSVNF